jgi:hypothetical protein
LDPAALLVVLTGDLGAGDPFTEEVAAAVVDALGGHDSRGYGELDAAAFAHSTCAVAPAGRTASERP